MAKDLTYVREGEAAYWAHEPYEDPPYEQRDFKCLDWQDGWLKAKAADDRGEGPPGEQPNSFYDILNDDFDVVDHLDEHDTEAERQYVPDEDWHGWYHDDYFV
jgi:hypothetical protein